MSAHAFWCFIYIASNWAVSNNIYWWTLTSRGNQRPTDLAFHWFAPIGLFSITVKLIGFIFYIRYERCADGRQRGNCLALVYIMIKVSCITNFWVAVKKCGFDLHPKIYFIVIFDAQMVLAGGGSQNYFAYPVTISYAHTIKIRIKNNTRQDNFLNAISFKWL